LQFNVSKSQDRVLLAITLNREVGVDIEGLRSIDDAESIARRIFSANEQKQLLKFEGRGREEYFFRIWARKEAVIKALGLGLSADLQNIDLAEPVERTEDWIALKSGTSEPLFWRDLNFGEEFAAALAVRDEKGPVERFEWTGTIS
jgi:4'-phosphopantetheinyl transferase